MKIRIALAATALLAAGSALAELPAEKQRELAAAGITDWTPGQNAAQGPAFAVLQSPISAPIDGARDTQTMQYDDGTISALPTSFGTVFGNRFSLGVSSVELDTVTLNSFSFYFAEDSTPDTNLFVQPAAPGTTSGMIDARASVNLPSMINAGSSFSMLTTINVIPQTALGTTGMFNDTFFLGAWNTNANATVPVDNETVGLSTNGPRQQGYTASSGVGAVAAAAQSFNVVLRANITSPNMVPVELMAFDVD